MECVDGVCCNTACDGPNEVCNLPGREGTCLPRTAAPAPTLTWPNLILALGALSFIAAVAIRRRRPGHYDRS
jgi:MYXO-CTERM domain-containing protein